jgi:hypothetical protein
MPSRKQRRRREKLKRHEYEYVIETEEGEEIPVERPNERERKTPQVRDGKPRAGVVLDRRGRPIPKPSFQRSARLTLFIFPILLLVLYLSSPHASTVAKFANALLLAVFFIPMSYMMDAMRYRSATKGREKRD